MVAAGVIAVPAVAQMRIAPDGQAQGARAGTIVTIHIGPDGQATVIGQPAAGPVVAQSVSVTTVETSGDDADGSVIQLAYETRIEPVAAMAYAPLADLPPALPRPMIQAAASAPLLDLATLIAAGRSRLPSVPSLPGRSFDGERPLVALSPAFQPSDGVEQDEWAYADTEDDSAPIADTPRTLPPRASGHALPLDPTVLAAADPSLPGWLGQAEPQVLRICRDGDTGHFIAPVRINGVNVRAIIDTGAQNTILSARDARITGAAKDIVRSEPMTGIGGYTMLNVTRIHSMEIGGQELGSFTAAIGQEGIPYTLLGQTEIARLGRIVIEDGVMTITPRSPRMASR